MTVEPLTPDFSFAAVYPASIPVSFNPKQWSMKRLLTLMTISCLALSTVGLFSNAAGATVVFRVHTYNMAMGNPDHTNFSKHNLTRDNIISYASTFPAWQISLEESCKSQTDKVLWDLNAAGGGYGGYFFGQASYNLGPNTACRDGSPPFGNAVLAIGNEIGPNYLEFTHYPGQTEKKNMACVTMQNFGFKTENCALHLTNQSQDFALQQMNEALFASVSWSSPWGPSKPIVAGDFNIHYPIGGHTSDMDPRFQAWYPWHNEAWLGYWRPTADLGGTMEDYIWTDYPFSTQYGRYGCVWPPGSDHGICPGVFALL